MSKSDSLTVTCPDCGVELVVDVATGRIIHHKKPKEPIAGGKDFDSLFADLDGSKSRADELFERELSGLKDQERLREEIFRERLKRVEEDPDEEGQPVRPWDLD